MSATTKSVKPVRRKSSTRQAVEIMRKMILDNQLAPGSTHLESELAELLNKSRTPVREATLILEAQGLLEVKPRHGVRILSFSLGDIEEIYEVLTELESLAAQRAASKGHPEEEFRKAECAITAMDQSLQRDDRESWAEADETFHRELVRLGGNSRILNIVEMYSDQVRRARALTLYLRPAPTKSNDDHRDVLNAIRAGDQEKACSIHKMHRLQARELLMELLVKYRVRHV
ncbi:MAG: GntR family transcriptional regulator [Geminicoccales bacterium]